MNALISRPVRGFAWPLWFCLAGLWLLTGGAALAGEVRVAVAANFTAAMKELTSGFETGTGHRLRVSYGSTGKLYAQIVNGAPFDVFLAADQVRPARLQDEGHGRQRFTYAVGRLVLWSADPHALDGGPAALEAPALRRLAIANPTTAPYGAAAMEVLQRLGLADTLRGRLVRGDNIAQTYQFVATGNAQMGFVALSQTVLDARGSSWTVPESLHQPIRQDALLLDRAAESPAASAFFEFLGGARAGAIIRRFGYGLESDS